MDQEISNGACRLLAFLAGKTTFKNNYYYFNEKVVILIFKK